MKGISGRMPLPRRRVPLPGFDTWRRCRQGGRMTDVDRLRYDAWTRQLERMRAMQYAYNRKFFVLLTLSTAGVVWAMRDGSAVALAMVGPGLVTTGMTASFFLHQCDFARTHARALERWINGLLGQRVLIASEMEAEYFYPHAAPKLSGVVWGHWTLFTTFTLHFCGVWTAATVWALWRLWAVWFDETWWAYAIGLGLWAGLNVAVLHRWFGNAAAERRMEEQLASVGG